CWSRAVCPSGVHLPQRYVRPARRAGLSPGEDLVVVTGVVAGLAARGQLARARLGRRAGAALAGGEELREVSLELIGLFVQAVDLAIAVQVDRGPIDHAHRTSDTVLRRVLEPGRGEISLDLGVDRGVLQVLQR